MGRCWHCRAAEYITSHRQCRAFLISNYMTHPPYGSFCVLICMFSVCHLSMLRSVWFGITNLNKYNSIINASCHRRCRRHHHHHKQHHWWQRLPSRDVLAFDFRQKKNAKNPPPPQQLHRSAYTHTTHSLDNFCPRYGRSADKYRGRVCICHATQTYIYSHTYTINTQNNFPNSSNLTSEYICTFYDDFINFSTHRSEMHSSIQCKQMAEMLYVSCVPEVSRSLWADCAWALHAPIANQPVFAPTAFAPFT